MRPEAATTILQLTIAIREELREIRQVVDAEALQVSDRHLVEHSLAAIDDELDAMSEAVSAILGDPTKKE